MCHAINQFQYQYTNDGISIVPEHLTRAEIRERAFTLANEVERAARAYKLNFQVTASFQFFWSDYNWVIFAGSLSNDNKVIKPSSTNLSTDEVWMHLFSLMTAIVCYLTYFLTLAHQKLIGPTRVTGYYMAGNSVTLLWRVADSVSNVYNHSDNSAFLWLIFAWHNEGSWIAQQMLLSRVAFVATNVSVDGGNEEAFRAFVIAKYVGHLSNCSNLRWLLAQAQKSKLPLTQAAIYCHAFQSGHPSAPHRE